MYRVKNSLRNLTHFLLLSIVLVIVMAAGVGCQPPNPQPEPFAKPVPSAVVEIRDRPTELELARDTQVVMLGTGTPIPDAYRAGPSIAVIHKGEAYLFDIGAGSVANAATARYKYDIPSLYPLQICCVFLTHLHSDHTDDLSELAFKLWWRRTRPLAVWGPVGLSEMAAGMYAMMAPDARLRASGTQPVKDTEAYKIEATEITEGVVLQKDDLTIEAFLVSHGDIAPAFGYRITTAKKTIVISGDTSYNEKVLEMARGADLLIHEVISDGGLVRTSADFQAYHRKAHTTARDLGRLAIEAKPGKLILYHALYYGVPEQQVLDEVRSVYNGEVILANDLDSF